MNPVFIFLVLVGVVALWFLLSFTFPWVGWLIWRLWKDAETNMNKGKIEKEEKENENER